MKKFGLDEYQKLASRTINKKLSLIEQEHHALHGMVGEVGEVHSIYQKHFQGHDNVEGKTIEEIQKEMVLHLKKEVGDLLWFVAEYCTSAGWKLSEIAQMNIDKLKARYPEGFEEEKSKNRAEGDI